MRCAALAAVAALALAPAARGADLFVDAAIGSDANAGLSWGAPKATVLAALADAALTPGPDVVSVAAGVYLGDIDVPPDVTLMGGFASGGTTRDIAAYRTTLLGEGAGPVVLFGAGADACVLDGFVVTGGWSDSASYDASRPATEYVGGIAIVDASPTIRNCLVQGNEGLWAGGIYAIGSAGTIEDCVIQGNVGLPVRARLRYPPMQVGQIAMLRTIARRNRTVGVQAGGITEAWFGGVMLELPDTGSRAVIDGCVVVENEAVGEVYSSTVAAEALHLSTRSPSTERWTFRNSVFGTTGKAAFIFDVLSGRRERGLWDFDNCLITGPRGYYVVFDTDGSWSRFTNCTIADGAILVWHVGGILEGASDMSFDRCILPTLRRMGLVPTVLQFSNSLVMDSSAIPGSVNVINADPLFVPGPAHDYYLSDVSSGQVASSPAIDQGPVTSADAALDGCTTRTDGGADTGLVDWGYHDCGIIAGGPWADEPAPPILEIWRGQADARSLWSVTTRLPWFEQRDTAPDTVSAGALLFYDVRGAVAPIHVARTPENASVVLTY